jgi:hypothetical protein
MNAKFIKSIGAPFNGAPVTGDQILNACVRLSKLELNAHFNHLIGRYAEK